MPNPVAVRTSHSIASAMVPARTKARQAIPGHWLLDQFWPLRSATERRHECSSRCPDRGGAGGFLSDVAWAGRAARPSWSPSFHNPDLTMAGSRRHPTDTCERRSRSGQAGPPLAGQQARAAYAMSVGARASIALTTPAPFVERLVHFWANHFAFRPTSCTVIGLAGRWSSRRSARTCSASFERHGCSQWSGIRRCCSTSTRRNRSGPTVPRGEVAPRDPIRTARAGSTKTSRARSWSCTRSACAPAIPRPTSPNSRAR